MADDDEHEIKPKHWIEAIDMVLWEAEQDEPDEDGKR